MSFYDVTRANVKGPLVFSAKGYSAPLVPDGDGIITIHTAKHNACIVQGGSVISGIRLVDEDGNHPDFVVDPTADIAEFAMFMLVSSGAALTIVHEDLGVTEARERIAVDDGANTAIDSKMVQAFFWPWLSGGVGRVRVFDWANVP